MLNCLANFYIFEIFTALLFVSVLLSIQVEPVADANLLLKIIRELFFNFIKIKHK